MKNQKSVIFCPFLYRCYFPNRSRDSVSLVYRIFFSKVFILPRDSDSGGVVLIHILCLDMNWFVCILSIKLFIFFLLFLTRNFYQTFARYFLHKVSVVRQYKKTCFHGTTEQILNIHIKLFLKKSSFNCIKDYHKATIFP